WETMVYLTPNDTYSLVGAPEPPVLAVLLNPSSARQRARESSTVYPTDKNGKKPTGELHGVLSRGRGNWYSPLNAETTGLANFGLYDILAPTPISFPAYNTVSVPFTDPLGEAYRTINKQLCGGGNCVRNAYSDLNIDLGTFQNKLSNMFDPVTNANCN